MDQARRAGDEAHVYRETAGEYAEGTESGRETFGASRRWGGYGVDEAGHGDHGPEDRRGDRDRARSDAEIQGELERRFAEDGELDDRDVRITVKGGEAILQGSVGTRREVRTAGDIAKACRGVRSVRNDLGVRAGELPPHHHARPGGSGAPGDRAA
jgi:osmotically-inducible protein OsmY